MQDPPEYYDPPGGLLTFDLQLGDLVKKSAPTNGGQRLEDFAGHFELVNAQLQQVLSLHFGVLPATPCAP